MIRGIHHVAMATGDLDRIVEFYEKAFGFEVVSAGSWQPGSAVIDAIVGLPDSSGRSAMLRAGNTYLEVFQYRTPAGKPNPPDRPASDHGYTHFCVDVTDIDAEYERLLAAGMRFHIAPPPKEALGSSGNRATYGRDPDGNIIEIQEVPNPDHPYYLDVD